MNVLMFLVYTVFGSNALAFVQHHAAVQSNNVVNCKRFDVNKHCVDGNKVLSSHSNKSVSSSADSRVNTGIHNMRSIPRRLPQRGVPRLQTANSRKMMQNTMYHNRRGNGQRFPKLKAVDNGVDDDGDDDDDISGGSSEGDDNTYYDDNDDNDLEDYDEYEVVDEVAGKNKNDVSKEKGDDISSKETGGKPIQRREGKKTSKIEKTAKEKKDNESLENYEVGDKQQKAGSAHKGRKTSKKSKKNVKNAKRRVKKRRKSIMKKCDNLKAKGIKYNEQSVLKDKKVSGLKKKKVPSVEVSTMSLVEQAYRRAMSFTTPKESNLESDSDPLPSDYEPSASSNRQRQTSSGVRKRALAGSFSQIPVRQTFKHVASMVWKYGDLLLGGMNIVDLLQNMEFPFFMMIVRRIMKAIPPSVLASCELNLLKKVIPICIKNKVIQIIKNIPVGVIRKFPACAIKRLPIRQTVEKLPISAIGKVPISAIRKVPIRVIKNIPFRAVKKFPVRAANQLPISRILSYTAVRKAA